MLISAIVVHLALPFTNGVVCSLPGAQDPTESLTLASFTSDGQLPSFTANESTSPVAFPEIQTQTGAHGIATNTVWDPMLVTLSLPTYVLRSPLYISAERLATNSNALRIWRPPIPFLSSL